MSIEDYNFSDPDFNCRPSTTDEMPCLVVKATPYALLDKEDAVALAKHFKLTEEDLK